MNSNSPSILATVCTSFLPPVNLIESVNKAWETVNNNKAKPEEISDARRRIGGAAAMALGALVLAYAAWSVFTFSLSISFLLSIGAVVYLGGKSVFENRGAEFVNSVTDQARKVVGAAAAMTIEGPKKKE